MLPQICIALALGYVVINILSVAIRNYRAHQFFKTRAPNLPVLPNPSIFSGHIGLTTWQPKNYKIITQMHKKYGTTFGWYMCNQPYVSTMDLDLLRLIEVDQAHKHINRSFFGLPFDEFNNCIFQVDDDDWRRMRRAVAPAFTNHKVRSEEVSGDIEHVLKQLVDALELKMDRAEAENGSREMIIDAHDTFQRYALAVIFLTAYKRDNEIDFVADVDPWVKVMQDGAPMMASPVIVIPMMFAFLRPLCKFFVQFHPIGKMQAQVVDYIIQATDINRVAREIHTKYQRKLSIETGAKERDFSELKRQGNFRRRLVDNIIDAYIDKKVKYDEFVASLLFLLLAGFETTADTLTCLTWHLVQNPDIQEKMRRALIEEGIDSDYVTWCIMETIRWHPAVPLGTGRIVTEDLNVNGQFIPKGTFVMPSTYSIHHNDQIWPEADKFKPERWRHSKDFHPAAFMGFGLGPRNCVGGKLAIHEIRLVMKFMLTKYRIERCLETPDKYEFTCPGLVYTILDEKIKVKLVALEKTEK